MNINIVWSAPSVMLFIMELLHLTGKKLLKTQLTVGIIERKGVKMKQTIGEYIKQDATFWTMSNTTYYYVYIDVDNDNEEIPLAQYNSMLSELSWENDEYSRNICMNNLCEYVERKRYTYGDNTPDYIDILIYDIPEE